MTNNLLRHKKDIIKWLAKQKITGYTLVENAKYGYVVDVNGIVDLSHRDMNKIEVKFGEINGWFSCVGNELTSLEGAPDTVYGDFHCGFNKLKNLLFSPIQVTENFSCLDNNLISLEGAPKMVRRTFDCSNNCLKDLKNGPRRVGGDFYCHENNLMSLEGAPKRVRGSFYCHNNKLKNLAHSPIVVGENFICSNNKLLNIANLPLKIGGVIYVGQNQFLKHLENIHDPVKIREILSIQKEKEDLSTVLDKEIKRGHINKL